MIKDKLIVLVAIPLMLLAGCGEPVPQAMGLDPATAYNDARDALVRAADDPDPSTRSHAMEALAQALGPQAGQIYLKATSDPNAIVQFAAIMAIGDSRYVPAKETLLSIAQRRELDKNIYCAVIYALYRVGNDDHAGDLAPLLFDSNKWVRANAALVMEKMQEPSAIGPLKSLFGDEQDPTVQLQLVEALAVLGDERSANLLEAYTKTPFLDERLVAIPAMEKARSPRAVPVLRELMLPGQQPRVRVAAAGALVRLGEFDERGYALCIQSVRNPTEVLENALGKNAQILPMEISSLQSLAAISLGYMGRTAAVDVLYPLLKSTDGGVRTSGAMSILRLLEQYGRFAPAEVAPPPEKTTVAPTRVEPRTTPSVATSPAVETLPPVVEPSTQPENTKPSPAPAIRRKLRTSGGKD